MGTDLKQQIKDFLDRTQMKPYHFAQAVGISPSQISRYLNTDRGMNWKTAEKIIKYMDADALGDGKEMLE